MKKIILILLFIVGCSSSAEKINFRYEGIKNTNLRVYLKEDLSSFPKTVKTENELKKTILTKTRQRTIILIDNYINILFRLRKKRIAPHSGILDGCGLRRWVCRIKNWTIILSKD